MIRRLSLVAAFLIWPALVSTAALAQPAPGMAVLELPEQIEIATINDVEVRSIKRLLGGNHSVELAPGRYEILAYYHEIWPLADGHDTLMSDPALFVLDAESGHHYTIEYPKPDDHGSAKALTGGFKGWLVDTASGQRTASQDSGLRFRRGLTGRDRTLVARAPATPAPRAVLAPRPLPAAPTTSPAVVTPSPAAATPVADASAEWLPMMKAWWNRATAEERRAFLDWVSSQR